MSDDFRIQRNFILYKVSVLTLFLARVVNRAIKRH